MIEKGKVAILSIASLICVEICYSQITDSQLHHQGQPSNGNQYFDTQSQMSQVRLTLCSFLFLPPVGLLSDCISTFMGMGFFQQFN